MVVEVEVQVAAEELEDISTSSHYPNCPATAMVYVEELAKAVKDFFQMINPVRTLKLF